MQEHKLQPVRPSVAAKDFARLCRDAGTPDATAPNLTRITATEFAAILTGIVPHSVFHRTIGQPADCNGVRIESRWTYFLIDEADMAGGGVAVRFSRWNTIGARKLDNTDSEFFRFEACKHDWQPADLAGVGRMTCTKCKRSYLNKETIA